MWARLRPALRRSRASLSSPPARRVRALHKLAAVLRDPPVSGAAGGAAGPGQAAAGGVVFSGGPAAFGLSLLDYVAPLLQVGVKGGGVLLGVGQQQPGSSSRV